MRSTLTKILAKIKKLKLTAIIDGIYKILLIINLVLNILRNK
ncbi:hypothetical protein [Tissierella simiarum]|nr:hypothetical protein [Tissierella simiarum]